MSLVFCSVHARSDEATFRDTVDTVYLNAITISS